MKVLLTEPPVPVSQTPSPPLGLGYLASHLENKGHEVKLIDPVVLKYKTKHLTKEIKRFNPDVLGLSAMTPHIYDALSIIEYAKINNPNCLTVLGGPHPTLLAKDTLKESKYLDLIVRGEGEITLAELLDKKNREEWKDIKGISWQNNGKVYETENREMIKNLDELIYPAYHLLPMDKYKVKYFDADLFEKRGQQYGTMFTSRGCPSDCAFCASCRIWGRTWRSRTPEKVVDELKLLVEKYNKRVIKFIDDTFTLNINRAKEICNLIKKEKLDISLICITRVDTFNKEIADALKKAGCFLVFFGIESGVQKTLDYLNKGFKLRQAEKAVNIAQEAGFQVISGFIIGVPGETKEDINTTIKFAKKLKLRSAKFFILTPYPGTKVYEMTDKENMILTKDWSEYTLHTSIIDLPDITRKELLSLKRKAHFKTM